MKVVFPRNIEKWMMASMTFNIGPLSLSIIQLLILALGIAAGLWIFNAVAKSWSKAAGAVFALPVVIIFIVIAFFKVSELSLIPYLAKVARNNFFDTIKKFQVNYEKFDPMKIAIKKSKADDNKKQSFEQKNKLMKEWLLENMEAWGLI